MMTYDCTEDVIEHKRRIKYWMCDIAHQLQRRAEIHDDSKLRDPEKAVFDEWTSKLGQLEYGSEEYNSSLEQMDEGLRHHYRENRHHPEHFVNGVNDMTLIDLVEMFCDWLAAAERKKTHIDFEYSQRRFDLNQQLINILISTAEDIDFWSKVNNMPVPQFSQSIAKKVAA